MHGAISSFLRMSKTTYVNGLEMQRQTAGTLDNTDVAAILNDEIGSRGAQFGMGKGRAQCNNVRSRSLTGQNSGGHIFADNALRAAKAELFRCFEKRFGIGFAASYIGCRDHTFRNG